MRAAKTRGGIHEDATPAEVRASQSTDALGYRAPHLSSPSPSLLRASVLPHARSPTTPPSAVAMIKGILIVNNFGKPRLVKFYQSVTNEDEQQNVIRKVFQQVAQRPDSFCNYLEGSIPEWGEKTKIIYRHYATLYFIFAVDQQESDLGILDLIQVFVEALDKCFENVCELDLIFHSDKVNYILDEIIMAGMVLETNINHILSAVQEQSNLHTASIQTLHNASAAQIQMSSAASHATDIGGKIFSSISGSFAN